ncbi:MAG: type II toxin-antitoxin system VapC family toxin [Acidobacteriota bacterium]
MIVIDASAMLEVLLATPSGQRIFDRIYADRTAPFAPELLDLEIAQVLRRLCRQGEVSEPRAQTALSDFASLPINRLAHGPFMTRIWELRHNLTAYDAAYVALAEGLACPLLTRDARLAAAPSHRAVVEVF